MKLALLVISLVAFLACKKDDCSNGINAKFKDLTGLDGCGMVIELEDGTRLEPVNLSDISITPKDGMKIRLKYHSIEGGSICMVGETVKIDCLEKR